MAVKLFQDEMLLTSSVDLEKVNQPRKIYSKRILNEDKKPIKFDLKNNFMDQINNQQIGSNSRKYSFFKFYIYL